jgi:hypothetical protein
MIGRLLNRRGSRKADQPAEDPRAPLPRELRELVETMTFSVREPTGDGLEPRIVCLAAYPLGMFQVPLERANLVRRLEQKAPGHSPRTLERLAEIIEQCAIFAARHGSTPSEIAKGEPIRRTRRGWAHWNPSDLTQPEY